MINPLRSRIHILSTRHRIYEVKEMGYNICDVVEQKNKDA